MSGIRFNVMKSNQEFELRSVIKDDLNLLFNWANELEVRKNSFQTEQIPYYDHKNWFEKLLHDETQIQYIFLVDSYPVGQIRFSIHDDKAEVNYSIDINMRGKGYGKKILELAKSKFFKEYPKIKKIIARVKKDNEASKKSFCANGYEEVYTQYELFRKD